jgi:hypothetical protein
MVIFGTTPSAVTPRMWSIPSPLPPFNSPPSLPLTVHPPPIILFLWDNDILPYFFYIFLLPPFFFLSFPLPPPISFCLCLFPLPVQVAVFLISASLSIFHTSLLILSHFLIGEGRVVKPLSAKEKSMIFLTIPVQCSHLTYAVQSTNMSKIVNIINLKICHHFLAFPNINSLEAACLCICARFVVSPGSACKRRVYIGTKKSAKV